MQTRIEPATFSLLAAVEYLRAGEVVAFPTETVYGLGADARRDDAIRKIYEAKGRPAGNPVIVHVATVEAAREYTGSWPQVAETLSRRFWPGPLTMILPRGKSLSALVSAGRSTVAIRCPAHPVADALLRTFDGPIAAPSANRSGFTSPTAAAHVLAELDGRIPMILDGGPSRIGLESTVIDLSTGLPTVLRPGAITVEMLREAIGDVQLAMATLRVEESAVSPGLHFRHYAPRTAAYRFSQGEWAAAQAWAATHGPVALLSWADEVHLGAPHETIRLPGEGSGYAAAIYGALREADERKPRAILVLDVPHEREVWTAVADRLRRATQPLPPSGGMVH